jgi:farnesyl diphosphate synthase
LSQADFLNQWNLYKDLTETALTRTLSEEADLLSQAMRYSCLQGGKRFRATLVYATAEVFNTPLASVANAAAAIEMIHAYSLIHDDLPAMDDDDLRRGQPSCHIKFDEATAILTGDALQSLAFEKLSAPHETLSENRQLAMLQLLAKASGRSGMAGGQALDMQATGTSISVDQLQIIHENKTGALIRAAIGLGALGSPSSTEEERIALDQYGHAIGLAFQVADDILDQTQSSEALGKRSGADAQMQKNTYPSLIGLDKAKEFASQLHQEALQSLDKLAHKDHNIGFLRQLANFTISREY